MITIPKHAEFAINRLKANGFEGYVVGGCVRDIILGRSGYDIDVTTSAFPDEIQSVFSDFKQTTAGLKHGTVTVIIENEPIEITAFRVDGDYSDHRRPNEVKFTRSLKEDLSRRDFTINALCCGGGEVIDYFNGLEDLKNGVIRAVGEPKKRFDEDALRILRAFRFSAQLGFEIEPQTLNGAAICAGGLKYISKERITDELTKLLLSGASERAVTQLTGLNILPQILSPLDISAIDRASAIAVKWFILLGGDINKTGELSVSRAVLNQLSVLRRYRETKLPTEKAEVKQLLGEVKTAQGFNLILDFNKALNKDVSETEKIFSQILENNECYSVKQLKINGDDLIRLGICGEKCGSALNLLLGMVISGETENDREKLLRAAQGFTNRNAASGITD